MIEGVAGLALAIVAVATTLGRPEALPGWGLALGAAWTVFAIGVDAWFFGRARRRIEHLRRGEAGPRPGSVLPVFLLRHLGFIGLGVFGWTGGLYSAPSIAGFALGLAPWFCVWLATQGARRRFAEARGGRPWPAGPWWALHLRILLLPLLASGGMIAVSALVATDPEAMHWMEWRPASSFLVSVLLSVPFLAFVAVPLAGRLALPSRPLEAGPFRKRLEELAHREGFRPRDIRVIDTSGHIVNALFVGFAGPFRYVFFTDAILKRLSEDELVGVFAHELGHACRRHPVVYLTLVLALSALLTGLGILGQAAGGPGWLIDLVFPLAAFLLFFRFVFSPLSKAFETEADLFAVRALGDAEPIARSLEGLGRLYPQRRQRGGPLHPALDERVANARRWPVDADFRAEVEARFRRLRLGVAIFALGAFLGLGAFIPGELAQARGLDRVLAAIRADDETAAEESLEALAVEIEAGRTRDPGHRLRFALHQVIATHRQDRGDYEGAAVHCRAIRGARGDLDEPSQVYSAAIILAQQAAATGDWGRFAEELTRARRAFPAAEAVIGEADPALGQEKRDLAWLHRGRLLLERIGALPATSAAEGREALGELPEYRALEALESHAETPTPGSIRGWPEPALAALDERWRGDFLSRLRRLVEG